MNKYLIYKLKTKYFTADDILCDGIDYLEQVRMSYRIQCIFGYDTRN